MTLKYSQGDWKWYEWVKVSEYYHHAKFDIYRIKKCGKIATLKFLLRENAWLIIILTHNFSCESKVNWKMHWISMVNCVQNHNIFWDHLQLSDIALAVNLCFVWFAFNAHQGRSNKFLLLAFPSFQNFPQEWKTEYCFRLLCKSIFQFHQHLEHFNNAGQFQKYCWPSCIGHRLISHWHLPRARPVFSLLTVFSIFGFDVCLLLMLSLSHTSVDSQSSS